jgi:hypothetical protein
VYSPRSIVVGCVGVRFACVRFIRVTDVDEETLCQLIGVMRRMVLELHPQFRAEFVIGVQNSTESKGAMAVTFK